MPLGQSITFNNTASTLSVDTRLTSGVGSKLFNLKSQFYNNSWYVMYSVNNSVNAVTEAYVGKFDNDLSTRLNGFTALGWDANNRICNSGNTNIGRCPDFQILPPNLTILYTYVQNGIACNYYQNNFSLSDVSGGGITEGKNLYGICGGGCDCDDSSNTPVTSTYFNNLFIETDYFNRIFGKTGTWKYFKTSAQTLSFPSGLSFSDPYLFFNQKWFTYILIGVDASSGHIYAIHYDEDMTYLDNEDLSTLSGYFPSFEYDNGNSYYLAFKYNNTAIVVQTYDSVSSTHLVQTNEDVIIIEGANETENKTLDTPSLAFDGTNFWLFYSLTNTSINMPIGIYAIKQQTSCYCSNWAYVYEEGHKVCLGNEARQTRTCYPSGCDSEYNYTFDEYCNQTSGGLFPNAYISYRQVSNCQSCEDSIHDPKVEGTSTCYASLNISTQCNSSVTVYARLIPDVELSNFGLFTINEFWDGLACSFNTECNYTANRLCSEPNQTIVSNYTGYSGGQIANGQFQITRAGNCKDGLTTKGWKKYRVTGELCYSCYQACGGTKCTTFGSKQYSIPEYNDCSINDTCIKDDSCYCQYGCDNGVCSSGVIEPDIISTGDPLTIMFSLIGSTFPAYVINFLAIIFTTGVAIISYGKLKDTKLPLIVFLAFTLFFTMINWLPTWIGIVIIIGIVLLLGKQLWLK